MPHDVGEALASYLRDGRPKSICRRVFLRSRAPFDGLGSTSDICQIVHRAIDRAGIEAAITGSHQLRHALAVDMLRQGLSLTEIGQMLRHRSPEATRRYAKVDLDSLRAVALPWPGELPCTSLREGIVEYLELRRSLGFRLKQDEFRLRDFADFVERRHATHITAKLAVEWAKRPASTNPNYRAGRLSMVRSFARYRILSDPRTEIPATDLLPDLGSPSSPTSSARTKYVRILEESLQSTERNHSPSTCLGRYTIYGLISVTGMRVGEVLNLDLGDVDLDQGIITIRNAKFGKARLAPVHETTRAALQRYREERDAFLGGRNVDAFFVSDQRPPRRPYDAGPRVPSADHKARLARRLGPPAGRAFTTCGIRWRLRSCGDATAPAPSLSASCRR